MTWVINMTNSELVYGAVIFSKGEHKGKLGYYDNDEDKDAIVYLGKPFESEFITIPHSHIRNITSLEHERFKKENPELCKALGIS